MNIKRSCRNFTPLLAEKYKEAAQDEKIEVVFVSSDKDDEAFRGYFGEMPWLAVSYADRARKNTLSEEFGVKGIPCLVVLDGQTGELVTTEGRGQVNKYFGGVEENSSTKTMIVFAYITMVMVARNGPEYWASKIQMLVKVLLAIHVLEFALLCVTSPDKI